MSGIHCGVEQLHAGIEATRKLFLSEVPRSHVDILARPFFHIGTWRGVDDEFDDQKQASRMERS
jgi:hypothetical protein